MRCTWAASCSGSRWLTTGRRAPLANIAASLCVRWPSSWMSTPWKVMLASRSGFRSSSGVAMAAIWPPAAARSVLRPPSRRLPGPRQRPRGRRPAGRPAAERRRWCNRRKTRRPAPASARASRAANGDRLDPAGRGQLQQEQPHPAAGAQNQQLAARPQREPCQNLTGRAGGERRRRGVGERRADVNPGDLIAVHYGQLRMPAAAIGEVRHRHDPITGSQAATPGPADSTTPAMS